MERLITQTDNGSFAPVFSPGAQKRSGCRLRFTEVNDEDETLSACRQAHIVLATRGRFSKSVLGRMPDCLAIIRFGVGVEDIDLETATKLGVIVANVPDFCVGEVSDTAAGLILALNRRLLFMHKAVTGGQWDRRLARPIRRLEAQTLGLVGFGRIARAVAARMKNFGLDISAYDPYVSKNEIRRSGLRPVDLDCLLRQSDFISLHLPLKDETYHLIGEKQLRKMKRTAYLINTSRGKIINETALFKALKEKWIAGAALDVLEDEPPDPGNPLLKLDNVILTPHFGSYSEEAFGELENKVRKAALAVLRGEFPDHIVNTGVKNRARILKIKQFSPGKPGA